MIKSSFRDLDMENKFKENSKKLNAIIDEVSSLLADEATLYYIGNKTYREFESYINDTFETWKISLPLTLTIKTYCGHPLRVIEYYCKKFNEGKDE